VVAVERSAISAFAKAVKDENPIYHDLRAAKAAGFDNIPAPPTYPFAMSFAGAYPDLQEGLEPVKSNPMAEFLGKLRGNGLILHGEQEFVYHQPGRPVMAGDVLVGEGTVTNVYEKESKGRVMTFLVTETVWKEQATGKPVVTSIFNLIHRA
jgi:acyl dehydratase